MPVGRAFLAIERLVDQDLDDLGRRRLDLAGEHLAARAVDGKEVALAVDLALHRQRALVIIDVQRAGAADANLAHLPGDERRVRADAAARGEDAFRREHAANVLRRGLLADEQHLALGRFGFRLVRIKVDAAGGGAGTGGQPGGDDFRVLDRLAVEDGVSSWLSWSAGTRATASCQVISFSFTISQAMRTAATPVRLPLRVWSMKSLPFSTVNSKSCISWKWRSSVARTSSSSR